ncbi:MAG: pyridoxamine 5'-phosphate oxidase family protein [Syntrophobacteraceae bacterium]
MIEKMKALLRNNSLCILATCSENRPHCSLMTYITDEQGETIYTATLSASRKYRNIIQNPSVSLLVDSRMNDKSTSSIEALTVSGVASPIASQKGKDEILTMLVHHHPGLKDLLLDPDTVVIAIQVESFLLLEGPTHSNFVELAKRN